MNYTIYCKKCEETREKNKERGNEEGVKHEYRGESSRGCYTRFESHKNAGKKGFMYKHNTEEHGGDPENEYIIKREKIDKDPMRRVLRESIRIEKAEKDKSIILMNSGEERFGTRTVRVQFARDRTI